MHTRLLLCFLFIFSYKGYNQRLNMTVENVRLDQVLKEIQQRTGYLVWVDRSCVESAGLISFSVRDATLRQVMDSCLGDRAISYRLIGRTVNVYPGSLFIGQVVDERGQPVAGATVMEQSGERPQATMSDEGGRFRLRMFGTERSVLISYVGYGLQRYQVSGVLRMRVELVRQGAELSGVVVANGFEDIPAERATGAFGRVSREEIGRRPSASVVDRLDGMTSSLLVNRNIQAGMNQSAFTIRGRSTIFSNPNPLVVIDNFPYNGDLNNINGEDIESLSGSIEGKEKELTICLLNA